MRRALASAALAAVVVPAAAAGAGVDRTGFRYTRPIAAPPASGEVAFDADGPLFAHAEPGFADLRVLDARGAQVPWRTVTSAPAPAERPRLLDSGRQGGTAVALLDLGRSRRVHDRLDLDVAGTGFVGHVTVSGSDDRRTFTRLSTTTIYDVAGAQGRARSTVVTFPPSDFRYLLLRAPGVRRIEGATVSGRPQRPLVRPVPARTRVEQADRATRVVLDLGYRNVPVDELRVTTSDRRYDRPVTVEERSGSTWTAVDYGRAFRYYGTSSPPLRLQVRGRYLRVTIENGDDPALRGLRVEPLAQPRTLLLERARPAPLRVLYGGHPRSAPDYEFARLPQRAGGIARVAHVHLGPESLNPGYMPPPDTRSYAKKHPAIVDAALAIAAAVIAFGGFLALRRRA
jgi:hypothetical protein